MVLPASGERDLPLSGEHRPARNGEQYTAAGQMTRILLFCVLALVPCVATARTPVANDQLCHRAGGLRECMPGAITEVEPRMPAVMACADAVRGPARWWRQLAGGAGQ